MPSAHGNTTVYYKYCIYDCIRTRIQGQHRHKMWTFIIHYIYIYMYIPTYIPMCCTFIQKLRTTIFMLCQIHNMWICLHMTVYICYIYHWQDFILTVYLWVYVGQNSYLKNMLAEPGRVNLKIVFRFVLIFLLLSMIWFNFFCFFKYSAVHHFVFKFACSFVVHLVSTFKTNISRVRSILFF